MEFTDLEKVKNIDWDFVLDCVINCSREYREKAAKYMVEPLGVPKYREEFFIPTITKFESTIRGLLAITNYKMVPQLSFHQKMQAYQQWKKLYGKKQTKIETPPLFLSKTHIKPEDESNE